MISSFVAASPPLYKSGPVKKNFIKSCVIFNLLLKLSAIFSSLLSDLGFHKYAPANVRLPKSITLTLSPLNAVILANALSVATNCPSIGCLLNIPLAVCQRVPI